MDVVTDLVAALELMIAALQSEYMWDVSPDNLNAVRAARAAISKALEKRSGQS